MLCARALLATALASGCLAAAAEPWWQSASVAELEKALFVRGVPCEKCETKELRRAVKEHASAPIDPELQAMHAEDEAYQRHVRNLNMTKSELVDQMNETEDGALDAARAERMWTAFQLQLESGTVRFGADGTMHFVMPITHRFAAILPAAAADAIEDAFTCVRGVYMRSVPRKVRRRLERRVEWAADLGLLHGLLAVLLLVFAFDVLRPARSLPAAAEQPPVASKPKGD